MEAESYKLYVVRYRLQPAHVNKISGAMSLILKTTQDYNGAYWQADTLIANRAHKHGYVNYKILDVSLIHGNAAYAPDDTPYRLIAEPQDA